MDADHKAAKVSSSGAAGPDADRLLATQLIAAHNAAMASYRDARDEPSDDRRRHAHLTQACRFSRTFIRLFDRLDRRRAAARPTVTVLHVRRTATEQGRSRGLHWQRPQNPRNDPMRSRNRRRAKISRIDPMQSVRAVARARHAKFSRIDPMQSLAQGLAKKPEE